MSVLQPIFDEILQSFVAPPIQLKPFSVTAEIAYPSGSRTFIDTRVFAKSSIDAGLTVLGDFSDDATLVNLRVETEKEVA